ELQPHAMVLDIQNVKPEPSDRLRERGELSWVVADDDAEHQITAGRREAMLDELDQKDRIDVSARQHGNGRSVSGHEAGQDRGEPGCSGGFDDGLAAPE